MSVTKRMVASGGDIRNCHLPIETDAWTCFRSNFLNMDVFYQELSVQHVVQQPAFEFLSLLSEVRRYTYFSVRAFTVGIFGDSGQDA